MDGSSHRFSNPVWPRFYKRELEHVSIFTAVN